MVTVTDGAWALAIDVNPCINSGTGLALENSLELCTLVIQGHRLFWTLQSLILHRQQFCRQELEMEHLFLAREKLN